MALKNNMNLLFWHLRAGRVLNILTPQISVSLLTKKKKKRKVGGGVRRWSGFSKVIWPLVPKLDPMSVLGPAGSAALMVINCDNYQTKHVTFWCLSSLLLLLLWWHCPPPNYLQLVSTDQNGNLSYCGRTC